MNQIFYLKSNLGLSNPSSFDSKTIKLFLLNSKHLFSVKNSTQIFLSHIRRNIKIIILLIKKFRKKKQKKDGQTWSDVPRCGHLWSYVVICG